jgi:ferrous iron transport protein B
MHCHDSSIKIDIPQGATKVVLAGNPNVGKSVFFNGLTGLYVDVSNFPGTTVDISHGRFGQDVIIDTPGVYGVSSFNDEERVARDVIVYADVIINVVDALHLERDLFLTQQIIDMGKPIIVALNMMDDVEKNGIKIDVKKLSALLGVEVVPTVATKKKGMEELKAAIPRANVGKRLENLREKIQGLMDKVDVEAEALLVLEDDENIKSIHDLNNIHSLRDEIYRQRRERIDYIVEAIITEDNNRASFKMKLGRAMLRPLTGLPILFFTLYLMYQLIGVFVAQTVVELTEEMIMGGIYQPFVEDLVSKFISPETFIGNILIGEFGVLTMAVVYLLGLLLPLVVGFYLFLSVLEDSGYLPRIAALVDRSLTRLGLNGRAIIPIILGFGCVTMATITTRILGSKRERFIATLLLGLAIPCSAQLGVIAGLVSPLGAKYIAIYVVTILAVFIITGTLLNKVMPGKSTDLLIDLPPLRIPIAANVLKKTHTKTVMFLKEAAPLFVLGALLISIMDYTGALEAVSNFFAPMTQGFLKLDPRVSEAFIMGIVRRDFGAAGLAKLASEGNLSAAQQVVSLVAITLFVPCIAAIMVIFKERSRTEAAIIWFGSFIISFIVAGILAQLII